MSAPGWMPLHVAEYLADTGHLSPAEHGAYLLLIMHYWQNRRLPAEDAKLARICRMSRDEFADARDTLSAFFSDGWGHKRIDAELSKADEKYEKRAAAGRKGGIAKSVSGNATSTTKQCSTINTDIYKTEEDTKANALDAVPAPAQPVYSDASHELWGEALIILEGLGVQKSRIRPMIGKWCRDAGDDHAGVLEAIRRARDGRVQDPVSWITRAIPTSRGRHGRTDGTAGPRRITGTERAIAGVAAAAAEFAEQRLSASVGRGAPVGSRALLLPTLPDEPEIPF